MIFPVLAANHQVNRVAALAVLAAEMSGYGKLHRAQGIKNSRALYARVPFPESLHISIEAGRLQ
ncbi:MAG: hypothetical protein C3F07_21690 [Anaerolineales bacterium]|nr:MAG: hypothetical protein C3F07_21690 [Anaerolineales bacterium]